MSRPAIPDHWLKSNRPNSMHGGTGSSNDSREESPSATGYPINPSFYSSLKNALGPSRSHEYPHGYAAGAPSMPRQNTQGNAYRAPYPQSDNMATGYAYSNPTSHYIPEGKTASLTHVAHQSVNIRAASSSSARVASPGHTSPYSAASVPWQASTGAGDERNRPKERQRENVPTRAVRTPMVPQQLNYNKIMHCYNDIMATAAQDPAPGQLRELATRMHLPAMAGVRLFEPSGDNNSPPPEKKLRTTIDETSNKQSSQSPISPSGTPIANSQPKKQREGKNEVQVCKGCDATSTPEWRRGPLGPRTLCNACGLVYAKILKRRSREAQGGRRDHQDTEDVSSEGEGSDQDSFRSSRSG